jgi:glycosyltransferase involved in cell wall biosynthesis
MSAMPLVSVCIPSYNSAEFVAATVDSVLAQTFADFELIITDDCSSDRTVEVIRGFSDPRISLIQNGQNLGLEGNWNKALSCSRGKYVKLLCADDLLYPDCLKRQVDALEKDSEVVLAICNRDVINAKGKPVLRRSTRLTGRVNGAKLIRNSIRWGSNLIGEPAVGLFRKDAFSPGAVFHNAYLADLALWAEILKHGDAFVDATCLAAFRLSRAQASAKIGHRQAAGFRKFAHSLRKDSFYRVNAFDSCLGSTLSLPWCLLRNAFLSFAC